MFLGSLFVGNLEWAVFHEQSRGSHGGITEGLATLEGSAFAGIDLRRWIGLRCAVRGRWRQRAGLVTA